MATENKKERLVSQEESVMTADTGVLGTDDDEGIQIIQLRKPINFDGEMVEAVTLDLDSLTAGHLMAAEREAKMRLKKKQSMEMIKELDPRYTACVAAKAAGVKAELIFSLSGRDFTTVTVAVRNFLLGGESLTPKELAEMESSL